MKSIPLEQLPDQCMALLDEVAETGNPVVITKDGVPIARLEPFGHLPGRRNRLGGMRGQIRQLGDVISPASELDEWEVLRDDLP